MFGFSIQGGLGTNVLVSLPTQEPIQVVEKETKWRGGGGVGWGIKFCNNQVSRKKTL